MSLRWVTTRLKPGIVTDTAHDDCGREIAALEARVLALAEIVRQSAEWAGPDTGLCWALVPELVEPGNYYSSYRNPCTHPGCIRRRALIGAP